MLNLTVNELHTYYVIAGNTPVLVHNTPCITLGDASTIADHLDDDVYFHYTNEAGYSQAVRNDGVVLTGNARGQVYATQDIQSPAEAEQNLFINPKYAGKGDFVIIFRRPGGVTFDPGQAPNEVISSSGTVRVPTSNVIYAGPNPFS